MQNDCCKFKGRIDYTLNSVSAWWAEWDLASRKLTTTTTSTNNNIQKREYILCL